MLDPAKTSSWGIVLVSLDAFLHVLQVGERLTTVNHTGAGVTGARGVPPLEPECITNFDMVRLASHPTVHAELLLG